VILQNTEESPLFYFFDSALLEALQERHQLIGRTVSRRPSVERLGFGERLFFEFEAGVEINLRCVHSFMSEPQRDDGTINAALQQVHRGAVSQDVWSDALGFQRRTVLACRSHMLGEHVLNSVPAQRFATHIWKERPRRAGRFAHAATHGACRHRFLAQGNAARFAALADAAHMRAGYPKRRPDNAGR
jgi:hypothetical protein